MIAHSFMSKRVLVLGATGLLGNAVFRYLFDHNTFSVVGTVRSPKSKQLFNAKYRKNLVICPDIGSDHNLKILFDSAKPDVVINCISLNHVLMNKKNPLDFISTFALLPHRLAALCELGNARFIQISTDGVFSGDKGGYDERDIPDARDLYGLTKCLGEQCGDHSITLRTSILGHSLNGSSGLVDWFLSQEHNCQGFSQVVFSGLPTIVLAGIIQDYIITNDKLCGIYHLGAKSISKYELLMEISRVYHKKININPVNFPVIDRSLNSQKFNLETGCSVPEWKELIRLMYEDALKIENYV